MRDRRLEKRLADAFECLFKDPLTPTLTKDESIAFKTLKHDNSIVILKSDKGNSTVILDKVQYIEKMMTLLNSSD